MNWANIFKGFKTVIVGVTVAAAPAVIQYTSGIDVTQTFGLSPTAGMIIGLVIVGLRAATNTAIGAKA